MGRLIYSMMQSLDGYVADPAGKFDWGPSLTSRCTPSQTSCSAPSARIYSAGGLTQVNVDLEVEVAERVGIESRLAETRADLADMKVDLALARDDLSES